MIRRTGGYEREISCIKYETSVRIKPVYTILLQVHAV
jgi:hypothetical protein